MYKVTYNYEVFHYLNYLRTYYVLQRIRMYWVNNEICKDYDKKYR
jgi:hypothetical protein